MGCHISHSSAQHTDLLWLPDIGASVACFSNASSTMFSRQNGNIIHTDNDREEVLYVLA